MAEKMLAAVMTDHRVMEMREIDRPAPGRGELLIEIKHVGVCGSDLHMFQGSGESLKAFANGYRILGHEGAGIVAQVGEGVEGFSVGDKVALEPGSTCGECEYCKGGLYNLCKDVRFLSVGGQREGILCQYVAHPAQLCFKLPQNMTTLQGALIEPMAVGLHAANIGDAKIGMDAVVFGSGCIGLVTLLALKARGVSRVAVIDVVDIRLEKAKQLGADLVLNSMNTDITKAVLDWTKGRGVDVAFDASGNPAAIASTLPLVKKAGTIVLVGNPSGPMPPSFELIDFVNREITMKGVFRYRNIYPMAIQAVSSGTLPIDAIPDAIYPFAQTQKAFDDSIDNKSSIVKAVIEL